MRLKGHGERNDDYVFQRNLFNVLPRLLCNRWARKQSTSSLCWGREKERGGEGNAKGEPSILPTLLDPPYNSVAVEGAEMDLSSTETGFTFSLRIRKRMMERKCLGNDLARRTTELQSFSDPLHH